MSNHKISATAAHSLNETIIAGIEKHFAKVKSVTLAGLAFSPSGLKQVLQAEIDANKALDDTRAQLAEQVVETRDARTKAAGARTALRAWVLGNAGPGAVAMLKDFGMQPPKARGKRTVEAKAEAVTKGRATRKRRKDALATTPDSPAPLTAPAVVPSDPAPPAAPPAAAASKTAAA